MRAVQSLQQRQPQLDIEAPSQRVNYTAYLQQLCDSKVHGFDALACKISSTATYAADILQHSGRCLCRHAGVCEPLGMGRVVAQGLRSSAVRLRDRQARSGRLPGVPQSPGG